MPYVQFLFDHATKKIVRDSVSSTPVPLEPDREGVWKVVHDARGRVVLRGVGPGGAPQVIGTAKWTGERTGKRDGILDDTPSDEQWTALDGLLWPMLSSKQPADPSFIDDGAVIRLDSGKRVVSRIWAVIVVIVALVGFAGFVIVRDYLKLDATKANGESCKRRDECVSGRCEAGRCAALGVRGDSCTRDRQCSSGTCSSTRTCE